MITSAMNAVQAAGTRRNNGTEQWPTKTYMVGTTQSRYNSLYDRCHMDIRPTGRSQVCPAWPKSFLSDLPLSMKTALPALFRT